MIIDIHNHVGTDKDGTTQSIEELRESMKENKIDKTVIFPFNEREKDVMQASFDLLQYKNSSIIPFLRFDPKNVTPEEVGDALKKFAGVKLHTRSQNFDVLDERIWPVFKEIEKSRKPVIIHTRKENIANTDPDRVVLLAEHFPKMNIIIAHFAALSMNAFEVIGKSPNLYTETSILSCSRLIEIVSEKIGSGKIMFGSDSTYSYQDIELMKIKKLRMEDSEKEMILSKNAVKLLNLD